MSSIKIHQDIFNFERKRKGFTNRQAISMGLAGLVAFGTATLLGYALELNYTIVASVALCMAVPIVIAGFMPIHNMPAEEYLSRLIYLNDRGSTLTWQSVEHPLVKGRLTKEYVRKSKKKGFEVTGKDF